MSTSISQEYNEFIINNRKKVNGYLNMVLWLFVLTGPAIAMGVAMGIFPNVTYITCCYISTLVIGLSSLHLIMLRNIPHSFSASIFALTALDILLFYMCLSEVSIRITWFLVPFLSLLFCERGIYYYAFILNFITMFTATYVSYMYQFTPAESSHSAKILFLNSMDFNNLKTVNDTLGHNIGDELIKNASRCLSAAIGPLGTVYRVGGDEFNHQRPVCIEPQGFTADLFFDNSRLLMLYYSTILLRVITSLRRGALPFNRLNSLWPHRDQEALRRSSPVSYQH